MFAFPKEWGEKNALFFSFSFRPERRFRPLASGHSDEQRTIERVLVNDGGVAFLFQVCSQVLLLFQKQDNFLQGTKHHNFLL
jgi:hypothetical protein